MFRLQRCFGWSVGLVLSLMSFCVLAKDGIAESSGAGASPDNKLELATQATMQATKQATTHSPMDTGNWAMVLLSLFGIVALILLLGWVARRVSGFNIGNQQMKVVSALAVGNRERITLVDVQGKQFLVGITAQQISLLHAFDETVVPSPVSSQEVSGNNSDFAKRLQSLLKKSPSESNS